MSLQATDVVFVARLQALGLGPSRVDDKFDDETNISQCGFVGFGGGDDGDDDDDKMRRSCW